MHRIGQWMMDGQFVVVNVCLFWGCVGVEVANIVDDDDDDGQSTRKR